jgi:copper chaperone CopZ
MRKFMILTLVLSFLAAPAFADAKRTPDITLNVSGLVCDFCARAIEKVFLKQAGVTAVNVDLDNGKVTLDLKPGASIDDKTLGKLMTDSGYTVTGIQRAAVKGKKT